MRTAIWWIRRDLRLTDNQALKAAVEAADQVIPLFILDPVLLATGGPKKVGFLLQGLRELDARLRLKGSRLIVREGNPRQILGAIHQETQANVIFAEEDFSPYAQRRDAAIAGRLPLKLVAGVTVQSPHNVLKADGTPYTIFSPFSRNWKRLPIPTESLPAPSLITTPDDIASQPIPSEPALPSSVSFIAGELEARRRLRAFTSGQNPPIFAYQETRNRLDQSGTAGLSPYLRFGMLSARQAVIAPTRPSTLPPPNKQARVR